MRLFLIPSLSLCLAAFWFSSVSLLAQPVIQQETRANGFRFELVGATERGDQLEVVILVTAEEEDLWLKAYRYDDSVRHSRLVDDYGQVYFASSVELAGHETTRDDVSVVLTEGIRTRLVMRYQFEDGIPHQLQLVEAGLAYGNHQFFRVSFKGVRVGD